MLNGYGNHVTISETPFFEYKVGLAVKAAPDVSSEYPNRKRKGNCNWVVLVELSLSEYGTFFWHWPCILYY